MRSKILSTLSLSALLAVASSVPAMSAAQQIPLKVGYFNLALVKASYPESAGAESLRVQAENQLRIDVEEGNKRLQKAQEDKKPKEELEKMARDLQTEINAKQQALIRLIQTNTAIANQNIAQAVNAVAKDKGLDVVVDGAGVFAGGEKIVNSGEDITDPIVKRLTPNNVVGGSKSSGGGEAKPAAAPAAGAAK